MNSSAAPPGPRGLEAYRFFGGGSATKAFEFLQATARRYGPVSSFRVLNQRICLVDDAEVIREILVTQQHKFIRDTGATLLRELVGDGLLTSEEPRHRERRRIMQPAFHRAQVESYATAMVSESERLSNSWAQDQTLDIAMEMRRVTLAIVGSALFGVDFGSCATAVAEVLRRAIRRSARLALFLTVLEPLLLQYRRLNPRGPSLLFRSERAELERIIAPILEARRTAGTRDVLSLLLERSGVDGLTLTDEDVRNEIVTLVLAGHETTATALTWTWYLLGRHPAVEKRLHEELDSVLSGRLPALDDVPRLRWTSMVFTEAMRLYPPALAFGRRPVEPVTLGGYSIAPGTSVLVSPYITQRNPAYFCRPDEFLPQRWESISPPPFAYFPFGGGAKMCVGEPFAKLEGAVVLATLAQRWKLVDQNESHAGIAAGVTLNPDRQILMRCVAR